jgi:hypothetical protein
LARSLKKGWASYLAEADEAFTAMFVKGAAECSLLFIAVLSAVKLLSPVDQLFAETLPID